MKTVFSSEGLVQQYAGKMASAGARLEQGGWTIPEDPTTTLAVNSNSSAANVASGRLLGELRSIMDMDRERILAVAAAFAAKDAALADKMKR